ncbi:acetylornithine deacetylase/succinyldiaminopimelate desuccinylase-like deacylase [Terriglobus roseus DSM 18391]|uniref:Acetylornithine deacetylase/succinyldiaminopimelate desuccinylase-like deacylase n=1 Tax=Terriglobus roseus (strain DSM 18391 / NRRL B-41598 / KBS 63) TaxID=926566 RepID=I3ZF18_TERRK|nr:M20/M25/M40 family metallo-hydrolase [Terriglobus roseus]AFL87836.1 acetylornithine deacetylase/succinyldiaminopimelate desuccinylase-like deacylase [Terriglobus roseus DSM 18391]
MIFRERTKEPLPLARIATLAQHRGVHRAFAWLHLQEPRISSWQQELVAIPAPPFGEGERAAWFADRMRELGLSDVHIDEAGNALGLLRPDDGQSHVALLSAHLDTVFSADTELDIRQDESLLIGPGISDNGAGLAGLLALAAAIRHAELQPVNNILFAANVGEEAEGNLRGMRHLFTGSPFARRICGTLALEGAGTEIVVTRALGSRRFRVEITGPGGHAWTDSAVANPIVALSTAIAEISSRTLPARPRTTLNVGEIRGGTSVTAVAQSAEATFDLRSTDAGQLLLLEVQLYRAVEDAVMAANRAGSGEKLQAQITLIGDRPAAELDPKSRLLETVRAVDRHLRLRTEERLGSTDANIPLSLGLEAVAIGAGGLAGGVHTTNEWHDTRGRDLALRRVLLILLDLCGHLEAGNEVAADSPGAGEP